MGNCLDQYGGLARSGNTVIASYDDQQRSETYAIAWNRAGDGKLELSEMNSRYNRGNLPPGFREAEESLRASINESTRAFDVPTMQEPPDLGI